jgi:hypothetical protein
VEKVILFNSEQPGIKISMELYFNEKNELIFDGYDIGEVVEQCWGDSDYEYTYTLQPSGVDKLYHLLNLKTNDRSGLLTELQRRFSGNNAYSLFGEFMTANDISFKSFTWA